MLRVSLQATEQQVSLFLEMSDEEQQQVEEANGIEIIQGPPSKRQKTQKSLWQYSPTTKK